MTRYCFIRKEEAVEMHTAVGDLEPPAPEGRPK